MQDRIFNAMAAYKEIMSAPRKENENGWFPPPRDMQDKKWSKELRSLWAGYTSVRVDDKRFYAEKRKWSNENAQFYWVAGNEQMWYFSDRATALLFKLTFGGIVA
jgi:hypothetical protein